MKPKKGILKAVFRAIAKSFPMGNAIIEAKENFLAKSTIDISTKEIVDKVEKPHSWVSISLQLAITASLFYLFTSKQITVDDLERLLKFVFSLI